MLQKHTPFTLSERFATDTNISGGNGNGNGNGDADRDNNRDNNRNHSEVERDPNKDKDTGNQIKRDEDGGFNFSCE